MQERISGALSPATPDPLTSPTFQEYAEGWLKGKVGVKDATLVSYRGILNNHLIPYFGEAIISDIQREDIQCFVRDLIKKELSPKSVSNTLLVLHQILDDASLTGKLRSNPYIKIERPKIGNLKLIAFNPMRSAFS